MSDASGLLLLLSATEPSQSGPGHCAPASVPAVAQPLSKPHGYATQQQQQQMVQQHPQYQYAQQQASHAPLPMSEQSAFAAKAQASNAGAQLPYNPASYQAALQHQIYQPQQPQQHQQDPSKAYANNNNGVSQLPPVTVPPTQVGQRTAIPSSPPMSATSSVSPSLSTTGSVTSTNPTLVALPPRGVAQNAPVQKGSLAKNLKASVAHPPNGGVPTHRKSTQVLVIPPPKTVTNADGTVTKTFPCDQCPKEFATRAQQRRHIKNVHSERQFHCSYCGKAFANRQQANLHTDTVHKNKKAYACEICGKCFGHKHHVTTHVKTVHHKVKNFQCQYCPYRSGQQGHLTMHVDTVHLKRATHPCELCPADFTRRERLRKHMLSVHNCLPSTKRGQTRNSRESKVTNNVAATHQAMPAAPMPPQHQQGVPPVHPQQQQYAQMPPQAQQVQLPPMHAMPGHAAGQQPVHPYYANQGQAYYAPQPHYAQ